MSEICSEICSDNRFEIIDAAKKDLLESTNINTSPNEMKVLDNFLFRCWQSCEEDGDYMEEVFFDVEKAEQYCAKYNSNENNHHRHITKVNVTL